MSWSTLFLKLTLIKERTQALQIQVKEFTGPLHLLLQLVRREEMDIFDIDIHKIADQYLYILASHPIPDLHVAGDFIRMAATLVYIKSASLFPDETQDNFEDNISENLQFALVQNLLQIHMLQYIAKSLNRGSLLGRDVWARKDTIDKGLLLHKVILSSKVLIRLLRAYYRIQTRKSQKTQLQLEEALPTLSDCISALRSYLIVGASFTMSSLYKKVPQKKEMSILMIFLSFLELSRLSILTLHQSRDFSDIMVSVKSSLQEIHLESKIQELV